jgi:NTP pyrophosphatase (non-canonical NTP hydrolase)
MTVIPSTPSLTLARMRTVNLERCALWHPGGIEEWSADDWFVAMAGEAGEICNAIKKLKRAETNMVQANGPATVEAAVQSIASEIADTIFYLDLLCAWLGLDLEAIAKDALYFGDTDFSFSQARANIHNFIHVQDWHKVPSVQAHSPAKWALKLMRRVGWIAEFLERGQGIDVEMATNAEFAIGKTFQVVLILAERLSIDVEAALISTFNAVSVRNGFPQRL